MIKKLFVSFLIGVTVLSIGCSSSECDCTNCACLTSDNSTDKSSTSDSSTYDYVPLYSEVFYETYAKNYNKNSGEEKYIVPLTLEEKREIDLMMMEMYID